MRASTAAAIGLAVALPLAGAWLARSMYESSEEREARKPMPTERELCSQRSHCDVGLWDIDHAIDEATKRYGPRKGGIVPAVAHRAIAAMEREREAYLKKRAEDQEKLRKHLNSLDRCPPTEPLC